MKITPQFALHVTTGGEFYLAMTRTCHRAVRGLLDSKIVSFRISKSKKAFLLIFLAKYLSQSSQFERQKKSIFRQNPPTMIP